MAMDKGLGKKGQGAWQRGKEAGALERGPVPGRHVSRKGQWGGGGGRCGGEPGHSGKSEGGEGTEAASG